jgi:hypothetical protein
MKKKFFFLLFCQLVNQIFAFNAIEKQKCWNKNSGVSLKIEDNTQ